MAKAGFIMQGARGKLGDSVFQKGEKATIQRVKVDPKNPQTAKQMAQRVIFATVMAAARFLEPLINHSFENVATGMKSIREFKRLNLKRMRQLAAIDFSEQPSAVDANCFMTTKGISTLIPNRYIVSRGTIQYDGLLAVVPDASTVAFELKENPKITATVKSVDAQNDEGVVTVKVFDLLAILGIHSASEQLSFVFTGVTDNQLFAYNNDDAPGFVINEGNYGVRRIVPLASLTANSTIDFQVQNGDLSANFVREQIWDVLNKEKTDHDLFMTVVNEVLLGNDPTCNLADKAVGDTVTVNFDRTAANWDEFNEAYMGSNFHSVMGGLIRSKEVDGKWFRSTCILEGLGPSENRNYGLLWALWNAWFQGERIADDSKFLDQGGEGGSIND